MNAKLKWALSVAATVTAVPAGYAASVMLCGPTDISSLPALAALVLIVP